MIVFLSLGTNLGNRLNNLKKVFDKIENEIKITIISNNIFILSTIKIYVSFG